MIKATLTGCLAILCITSTWAQSVSVTSYAEDAGLARADVRVICQDGNGRLWIGTNGAGLYQFNLGRMHQNVEMVRALGYRIHDLAGDDDGKLYALGDGGLYHYDGQVFDRIVMGAADLDQLAYCNDSLWVAGSSGLYYGRSQEQILDREIRCLACTDRDELLAASADSLWIIRGDRILTYPLPRADWQSIGSSSEDAAWIGSREGTLIRFGNGRITTFQTDLVIRSVLPATGGQVWLGTTTGLSVFNAETETTLSPRDEHGMLAEPVHALLYDHRDGLWLGSETHGLLRYHGNRIQQAARSARAGVRQLTADPNNGDLWYLDDTGAIHRIDFEESMRDHILRDTTDYIQHYVDPLGRRWTASEAGAIEVILNDTTRQSIDSIFSTRHILPGTVRMIRGNRFGTIWIDTDRHLLQFGLQPASGIFLPTWNVRRVEQVPPSEPVALLPRPDHSLIRVDRRGIGMIVQNRYVAIAKSPYDILSADIDVDGRLWLGTQAGGILFYDTGDGEVRSLVGPYALQPFGINFIHATPEAVWAGTDRQLLHLSLNEQRDRVREVNELLSLPPGSLDPEAVAITSDNVIVAITGDMIYRINTDAYVPQPDIPLVYVRAVQIEQVPFAVTGYGDSKVTQGYEVGIPAIAFADNSVAFEVAGISFVDTRLTYQWKLDPVYPEWSEPSSQTAIQYTNLPPGDYAFDVRVCNDRGMCSQLTRTWKFRIRKALQHRWWFWVGAGILVIGMILFIVRGRERTIRREATREKERLDAQLRALTLEQKSLRLQMNPHFMFNAMQSIQHQIADGRLDTARTNLGQFAQLMRATLQMSRQEWISLEDEIEYLNKYMAVEIGCNARPVDWSVEIDPAVEPFAIKVPPLLFQPVIENALKHGSGNPYPQIRVRFEMKGKLLQCIVEDNGAGFGDKGSEGNGAALVILRQRLEQLGDSARLTLENRTDDTGQVVGARAEIVIPVDAE